MKKFFLSVLLILIISGCGEKQIKSVSIDDTFLKIVPSATFLVVKSKSYEKVLKILKSNVKIFTEMQGEMLYFKEKSGFDVYDLQQWQANGFVINKDFGFFLSDFSLNKEKNEPNIIVNVFLPVSDYSKAVTFLKDSFNKVTTDETNLWEEENGISFKSNGRESVVIQKKLDYMVLSFSEDNNKQELITKVLKKESILTNQSLKKSAVKIDPNEDLYIFGQMSEELRRNNIAGVMPREMRVIYKQLLKYNSIAVNVKLDGKDLLIKDVVSVVNRVDFLKEYEFEYDKNMFLNLNSIPVMAMTFGANYSKIFENLKKENNLNQDRSYKMIEQTFGDKFNVSFEDEIVNNLRGSFNLGVFDGDSINFGNTNVFTMISIKDEKKMQITMNKIFTKLPTDLEVTKSTIAGKPVDVLRARFFQIYFLIMNKNLIITTNKNLLTDAINGKITSGFSSKLPLGIKEKIQGDYQTSYLSFTELSKIIKNLFPVRHPRQQETKEKIISFLSDLNYAFSYWNIEGSEIYNQVELNTNYPGNFFENFLKKISEIE